MSKSIRRYGMFVTRMISIALLIMIIDCLIGATAVLAASGDVVVVSGAGTTAANGEYTYNGDYLGKPSYVFGGNELYWATNGTQWQITNNSYKIYYYCQEDTPEPWECTSWTHGTIGVDPVPSVTKKSTLVTLVSFSAKTSTANTVRVKWQTASEIDSAGFHIHRSETETSGNIRITDALIPAEGSPTQGASYEFIDSNVEPGKTYYYKLEDIGTSGSRSFYGPVSATVPASIPTITDFYPKRGAPGMKVVITGTNFTGTTVKFGGTEADSFTMDSETQITAVVGYGATGKVTVTTDGGTATSAEDFTYDPSIPTLNEWAMILFALLLLSSTVVVLRKRRDNAES